MVAYNFQRQFAQAIQSGKKHQTVRAIRKNRHARIGEKLQLYTGLRTKNCIKLIEDDPICTGIDDIKIHISTDGKINRIIVGDNQLNNQEMDEFARADGFTPGNDFTTRDAMGVFFHRYHGAGIFCGNVIMWSAR